MADETRQELVLEIDSLCGELVHCYQELSLFYRVTEKLGRECGLDGIARVALAEVLDVIPCGRASVFLWCGQGSGEIEILASLGLPARYSNGYRLVLDECLVAEVLQKGSSLLVDDIDAREDLAAKRKQGVYATRSMLSVPVLLTNPENTKEILGCINLADRLEGRGYFTSEDQKLLTVVARQMAVHIRKSMLFQDLQRSHLDVENSLYNTVETLARAAEERDKDTGGHLNRVGGYARALSRELGMGNDYCEKIFHFAKLHDVGKIHVHPDVLSKDGPLNSREWDAIKRHCEAGSKIIGGASGLRMAREIALTHHEQWDGNGYPLGLRGEENSLAGMITKLADTYDALRTRRSYKPAYSHARTCSILLKGDGRTYPEHFPPQVLQAFAAIHPEFDFIAACRPNGHQELVWGAKS